jgi:CheY-like chemotaxis protein
MASLASPEYSEHVMLLYDSDDERNLAAVHYINEGLKSGQLCVYASVGAYETSSRWHTSNISSRIKDYEENVKNGNLVILDFKPFFQSAQKGDLTPFLQLRAQLEGMLERRIAEGRGDRMMVFADAACTLSENKEFDECSALESWWHSVHKEWLGSKQNITVICPHPNGALDTHSKEKIGRVHSLTLHLRHFRSDQHEVKRATAGLIRVLIAEPNPDMRYLYRRFMDRLGFDVTIVESGGECLDCIFNREAGFDVVVLDANFHDMNGTQVAREIRKRQPDQKIIVTTTSLAEDSVREAEDVDMITKPFSMSKLIALINPKAS